MGCLSLRIPMYHHHTQLLAFGSFTSSEKGGNATFGFILCDIREWFWGKTNSRNVLPIYQNIGLYIQLGKKNIFRGVNFGKVATRSHGIAGLGKTLDILASSIISTYDVDKAHNSIIKMPLFHAPASHFSRIGHDTRGEISDQKLATTNSFRILVEFFCPPLAWHTDQTQYQGTASKGNIWGPFYIPKGEDLGGG